MRAPLSQPSVMLMVDAGLNILPEILFSGLNYLLRYFIEQESKIISMTLVHGFFHILLHSFEAL